VRVLVVASAVLIGAPLPFDPAGSASTSTRADHEAPNYRVSLTSSGRQGNKSSSVSDLSSDGRFVVFTSLADNFVAGDTDHDLDVFVHDRATGTTEAVSVTSSEVGADGWSVAGAVSDDGRFVVFASTSILAPGSGPGMTAYLRDRTAGTTTVIGPAGPWLAFSDDGSTAAIVSGEQLTGEDTDDDPDVYLWSRVGDTFALATVDSDEAELPGRAADDPLTISDDGSVVVFALDDAAPGDHYDLWLRDTSSGETTAVAVSSDEVAANAVSLAPSVSDDGNLVAFWSLATNLVPDDGNGSADVFLRDVSAGTTERISVDGDGDEVAIGGEHPAISGDGEHIAFITGSPEAYVPGAGSGAAYVVRDLDPSATEIQPRDLFGGPTPWPASDFFLSDDGSVFAFSSGADDLVAGDTNEVGDAFVVERTEVAPSCGATGVGVFLDVGPTRTFCTDIEWAYDEGIANGFGDGRFRPTWSVSRQAMAAFLYRAAGSPAFTPPVVPSFGDVPVSHPFFAEVEWLVAEGIATGFTDGNFRTTSPVSRQAMAAFLYQMAGSPPTTLPAVPTFDDVPAFHPFSKAIEWLAAEGIASGFPDGNFRTRWPVSRQAMAAFLHRADAL
jgi:Tol biopolymer transport system component